MGQLYRSHVFSVANGVVSTANLATNFYYDFNGNLLAESDPGGLVTKHQYDAANREIETYTTDGGAVNNGGTQLTGWSNAKSVANDVVVEQVGQN